MAYTKTPKSPIQASQTWLDRICLIKRREDPLSHTPLEKHATVTIVTLSAFTAPFPSCILFPSFTTLADHFHTSETRVALTTTVFLIGIAITPLWWGSLSQEYSRRPILLVSFALSAVAAIVCAVADSVSLVIGLRFVEALG
ncbi:major facilitator superfamily domain-containing protein [Aspergillus pseudoustus]|uniref:Major facilitator superfamily domain-containing protein n=1 Tax=Aspergillus pseudoustus TaxID=1810923 RepID=A0ABR4KC64_9EURO